MCLCAANPSYPSKQWDLLLTKAILTLNLLGNLRFNPKQSAYESLHDIFDYNKTPLAPLGTITIIYKNTTTPTTWSPRGTDGWYIGPDLDHYWCVEYYIPSTHSTQIADTIKFLLTVVTFTKIISEEYIYKSIRYIINILA